MTENSLTIINQNLTPSTWQMITEIAPAMCTSRLFGVASPEQAMAIMLKGYELGLSLTASFEFVQIIDGKPTLSPRGALALVQQSLNFSDIKIRDIRDNNENPIACEVWMKRKNGFEYTIDFTIEDAKKAGIVKPNSGWEKYPANMLRWRAVGYCIDVVFPDVIGGMKRSDELGAEITPEGDIWKQTVVENNVIVVEEKSEPEPEKETIPQYGWTLQDLLERIPDTDIMEVNDGQFPVTEEQINLTVHNLIIAGKIASEETDKRIEAKKNDQSKT
jgi:hypothetical protein